MRRTRLVSCAALFAASLADAQNYRAPVPLPGSAASAPVAPVASASLPPPIPAAPGVLASPLGLPASPVPQAAPLELPSAVAVGAVATSESQARRPVRGAAVFRQELAEAKTRMEAAAQREKQHVEDVRHYDDQISRLNSQIGMYDNPDGFGSGREWGGRRIPVIDRLEGQVSVLSGRRQEAADKQAAAKAERLAAIAKAEDSEERLQGARPAHGFAAAAENRDVWALASALKSPAGPELDAMADALRQDPAASVAKRLAALVADRDGLTPERRSALLARAEEPFLARSLGPAIKPRWIGREGDRLALRTRVGTYLLGPRGWVRKRSGKPAAPHADGNAEDGRKSVGDGGTYTLTDGVLTFLKDGEPDWRSRRIAEGVAEVAAFEGRFYAAAAEGLLLLDGAQTRAVAPAVGPLYALSVVDGVLYAGGERGVFVFESRRDLEARALDLVAPRMSRPAPKPSPASDDLEEGPSILPD